MGHGFRELLRQHRSAVGGRVEVQLEERCVVVAVVPAPKRVLRRESKHHCLARSGALEPAGTARGDDDLATGSRKCAQHCRHVVPLVPTWVGDVVAGDEVDGRHGGTLGVAGAGPTAFQWCRLQQGLRNRLIAPNARLRAPTRGTWPGGLRRAGRRLNDPVDDGLEALRIEGVSASDSEV